MKTLINKFAQSLILVAFSILGPTTAFSENASTTTAPETAPETATESPTVKLTTNFGEIVIALNPDKAPLSVENFLQYVTDGFYKETIFHRVIPGFMLQGGGFTLNFEKKETRPPIQNEADNLLPNLKYTIAMARTGDPHSATAQFFINSADNDFLNHRAKDNSGWGYTVFGQVIEGQKLIDWLAKTPTDAAGPFRKDVPVNPIVIEDAVVVSN